MDAFALLTGGVKFDRRRFAKDISAFQPHQQQQPAQPAAAAAAHTAASHGGSRKKKKNKGRMPQQQRGSLQQATGSDADVNGQGIAVFKASGPEHDVTEEADSEQLEEQAASLGDTSEEGEPAADDSADDAGAAEDEDEDEQLVDGDDGSHDSDEEDGEEEGRHLNGGQPQAAAAAAQLHDVDPGCPVVHTGNPLEAANVVRKHYRIKVSGSDVPAPLRSWKDLTAWVQALHQQAAAELQQQQQQQRRHAKAAKRKGQKHAASNDSASDGDEEDAVTEAVHATRAAQKLVQRLLSEGGWAQPTPIQRQAVPCLLASRELLAVAPTGSGKTLAFLVPLLLGLKGLSRREGKAGEEGPHGPRAVLLTPTHELAAQQARVVRLLLPGSGLKAALLTKATAVNNTFSKVDMLLANPLRLASLVSDKQVELDQVRYLVLDEADKLFDMGFVAQIDAIIAACSHPGITRALFSATLPDKVEQLARSVLRDPLRVTVGARNTAVASVKQRLLFVGREAGKLLALRQLLAQGLTPPVLVFVATKERAKALHRELLYDGVRVDSINAAQSHSVRSAAVDNFRSGRTWVLIATDLVGRGMDFIGVRTVVNYDFPSSTTDYIHRIGRTGRAQQTGEAVTFFVEEDAPHLRPIAHLIKEAGGEVPDWMLAMKKVRAKERKHRKLPDAIARGDTISTETMLDRRKRQRRQQQRQGKKRAAEGAPAGNAAAAAAGGGAGAPPRKKAWQQQQAGGDQGQGRGKSSRRESCGVAK